MSELTWIDLAVEITKEIENSKKSNKYYCVIRPGIYKYLKLMKYHHWKNKYLLWEHNWRMK
jgi:hypothetical protein